MATHTSILAWRTPMDRGAWRVTAHGITESDTTEGLNYSQSSEHFPICIEIKSGRTDRTFCLVRGLKGHYDQACMDSLREQRIPELKDFHSGRHVSTAITDPC